MSEHPDATPRSDAGSDTPGGSERPFAPFRVALSVFEGPVDLLHYLIRKNELDIHEIPLARITRDYLDYVDMISLVDLESAGDFIMIAAALLRLKSRSMFEPEREEADADEPTAARDELIQYLLEYEKLGGVADRLAEKEEERIGVFPRGGQRNPITEYLREQDDEADYLLFDLLTALRDVLEKAPKTPTHDVELMNVTSEMKQKEIMGVIGRSGGFDFIDHVTGQPRLIVVVTFIALLELIKSGSITIRQPKQFGRIIVYAREENSSEHS